MVFAQPAPEPQSPRLTVAVVGLGSIGGVAAGCLAAAGRHDVIACVRQPIARLTLEWQNDTEATATMNTVEVPLQALTDPAQARPVDWVLLCTKTYQTAATAPWLERLCTQATQVAVLQNGIGHVERVAPLANGAAIMPVVVYYNGERLAPDRVRLRQGFAHDVAVADDGAGRAFVALFAGTPLRIAQSGDIALLSWRKLLINAVANPITTPTLQRQAVLRRPDVQELCRAVLEEASAVGRAEGVRLADDEPARAMAALFTFSGELGTPMYFVRLAGARSKSRP